MTGSDRVSTEVIMKKPEPHTLQPDPAEGDRETIERELARQDGKPAPAKGSDQTDRSSGKPDERKSGA